MAGSAGKSYQRFLPDTILEHLYDKRELVDRASLLRLLLNSTPGIQLRRTLIRAGIVLRPKNHLRAAITRQ